LEQLPEPLAVHVGVQRWDETRELLSLIVSDDAHCELTAWLTAGEIAQMEALFDLARARKATAQAPVADRFTLARVLVKPEQLPDEPSRWAGVGLTGRPEAPATRGGLTREAYQALLEKQTRRI
jgi:hypothetical protein